MPLRRAGTVTNAEPYYDPGSAAHRNSASLRPGLPGCLPGFVVDGVSSDRPEIGLAVIIRRLSALRLFAVAGVALQHERPAGAKTQGVTEIRAGRFEIERRDRRVRHGVEPA